MSLIQHCGKPTALHRAPKRCTHFRFQVLCPITKSWATIWCYLCANGADLEIWRSDATAAGTQLVSSLPSASRYPQFQSLGNEVFFTVDGQLYKTDGTAMGTMMVYDIRPGASDSIVHLAAMGGRLWFSAYDDVHGREMWSSDGTAIGTQMLDDYVPGIGSGVVDSSFVVGTQDRIYFYATDGGLAHGSELRHTDGTLQGTALEDFTPGPAGTYFAPVVAARNQIFFNAYPAAMVCMADSAGIHPLQPFATAQLTYNQYIAKGDSLFFVANQNELWLSDGTVNGTLAISTPSLANINRFGTNGREVFFSAHNAPFRRRLWKTDGSAQGTLPLLELAPYGASSQPEDLAQVGNYVVFTAADSSHGRELWTTDGTPGGTMLLQDIVAGPDEPSFAGDIVWQNERYYAIADAPGGAELWKTDGTPAGTQLLKVYANASGDAPASFYPLGAYLYFAADDAQYGPSLWRTDGTDSGTILVQDFGNQPAQTMPIIIGHIGSTLLISVKTDHLEVELWQSNGLPNAGGLLHTFNGLVGIGLRNAVAYNNKLYFWGPNASSPHNIWVTNGTPNGTTLIPNRLNFPVVFSRIEGVMNGRLWLMGNDLSTGTEIWSTDGTTNGIVLLQDIMPGTPSSSPVIYAFDGNRFFFGADDGNAGFELWTSDGTAQGTGLIADLLPGGGGQHMQTVKMLNHKLYFSAMHANFRHEFGETDGTPGGTFWHQSAPGHNAEMGSSWLGSTSTSLLVNAYEPGMGGNLYRVDQGLMAMFADPTGDPQSFQTYEAVPLGNGLVIAANHPQYGRELFFADSMPFIPTAEEPENLAAPASLHAYPVPTSDRVSVQLMDSKDAMVAYQVIDLAGRVVQQGAVARQQSIELDLSASGTGMYLVQVQLARGGLAVAKVLKR